MQILIDETACRGCEACLLACSLLHEGQSNPARARMQVNKDMARYTFEIVFCRECDSPACQAACPSQAIQADARGVLIIDEAACLQCGLCAEACPYHAIFYQAANGRYVKCDRCPSLPAPACVSICPVGALALAVTL